MEVSLEILGPLVRRLTVRFSAAQVDQRARERLQELARTASIKGFRTGKIPAAVIEQRYGAKVRTEALAEAVASALQAAIRQENQRPALAPSIRAEPAGELIEVISEFEVFPDVGVVEVDELHLTRYVATVEETDIDLRLSDARRGMEDRRAEIRVQLERELTAAIETRTKADVLRQLSHAFVDIEVPRGLVDIEMKALLAQRANQTQRDDVQPRAEMSLPAAEAESRVRAFILLSEIARQNAIAPDQSRINATLRQIAADYDDPEKVVELYASDAELMSTLRNRVIEDQAVDWVLEHAQVTERKMAFSELVHSRANGPV